MTDKLKRSHLYRLVYRLQLGNGRWYKYEAYMTYLGCNKVTREAQFNLRPVAGTQSLSLRDLLEVEDLGRTEGRDDPRHKAKRSLGPAPKPRNER